MKTGSLVHTIPQGTPGAYRNRAWWPCLCTTNGTKHRNRLIAIDQMNFNQKMGASIFNKQKEI